VPHLSPPSVPLQGPPTFVAQVEFKDLSADPGCRCAVAPDAGMRDANLDLSTAANQEDSVAIVSYRNTCNGLCLAAIKVPFYSLKALEWAGIGS